MNDSKAQITEEIGLYLDEMRAAYPAIEEVWLIGPRATEPGRRDAAWELLLFADADTIDALRRDRTQRRDDVVLLVVTEDEVIESLSREPRARSLEALGWRREDPNAASYAHSSGRQAAVRLR
jgi:hypothetical protein